MLELTKKGTLKSMSSLEIAELTGKSHSHICRDIRNQLEQQGIGESTFGSSYLSEQNKRLTCYDLDFHQTMILVTGYSIPLRAKILKRWEELEKQLNNIKKISTDNRKTLTLAWSDCGVDKPHQYKNLTLSEYKALGLEGKVKDNMDMREILLLNAFESLEAFKLFTDPVNGYYEVKDSIFETASKLDVMCKKEIEGDL